MSMKRVAEIAGVSVSTVSRVLSHPEYKCASPEIRDRIFKAARQLNYVPNESARNLKKGAESKGKIHYIGVLMTRGTKQDLDPFFRELMHQIEGEIHRNMCILSAIWYEAMFSQNVKSYVINKQIDAMFEDTGKKLDGLIIIGRCDSDALAHIKKYCRNIVSVNRNSANYQVDEVTCDGKKIAAMAVEHLIGLGHRNIGYVGAVRNESRFRGYQNTLEKYAVQITPDFIFEAGAREAEGVRIMEEIMCSPRVPTAIYCANDIIAVGMLKYLSRMKNCCYTPSIIASDDIEEARYSKPMLTTVHLPIQEMSRYALQILLDRMNGGHKSTLRMEIECSLVVRESCSRVENTMECEYYI